MSVVRPAATVPARKATRTRALPLVATSNPPTNIVPTNIARLKLSGNITRKSHPFNLRFCWSQTP